VKIVDRIILPFQEDRFFSPIRDKVDYVRLLAVSARQLLLNVDDPSNSSVARLKLVVDRMSRLFFYKDDKFFSVAFPLTVSGDDGDDPIALETYSGRRVDNRAISAILSVINSGAFATDFSCVNFLLNQDDAEFADLNLIEELIQFEPSYLRYDCDPARENGKIHPLHHLDVNYSQYGTFKLGLLAGIDSAYFEDLQNIRTDCSFIKD
jgi:hypothetical protein